MQLILQTAGPGRYASELTHDRFQILELGPRTYEFRIFDHADKKSESGILPHAFPCVDDARKFINRVLNGAALSPPPPIERSYKEMSKVAIQAPAAWYPRAKGGVAVLVIAEDAVAEYLAPSINGIDDCYPKVQIARMPIADFSKRSNKANDEPWEATFKIYRELARNLGGTDEAIGVLKRLGNMTDGKATLPVSTHAAPATPKFEVAEKATKKPARRRA